MSRSLTTRRAAVSLLVAVLAAAPVLAGFAGTDVFLPMVGRQAGVFPSNWYTTVWVYNPTADAVTARLYLLERNTANPSPPYVDVLVAPGDTERLENVVETLFHKEVFGAMRVTAPAKLVVTSRVYSKGSGAEEKASVGQDFAGVPAAFAIGVGEASQVLGAYQTLPSADSDFRFNFGFVETTGHSATARVTVFDGNGAEQGSKEFQVREWSQRQVAFKDHFPSVSTENSRLKVEVVSGTGRVIAYGSGIANGSQDPTTFEMTYPDSLLDSGSVQHDATLTGDGTAGAPLGIAASATAGQVLTTVAGGSVAWQSLGALSLGLAAGAVPFGSLSGGLAQDPAALFWDSLNQRLGVGLAGPRDRLDVAGNVRISASSGTAGKLIIGDYWFLHGYGNANTFVGPSAGNFTMTGFYNTGVGSGSLLNLAGGSFNTAVGKQALWADTSGYENTAVGNEAMKSNTEGSGNTALGAQALKGNITGIANTALGWAALSSCATGHDNTVVGAQTMTAGSTGYANTAVGSHAMQGNTSGFNNVAVGYVALTSTTEAEANTALGGSSMYSTTTGSKNTAVGQISLYSNVTGRENTAVGTGALYTATSAIGNTALGYSALYKTTLGSHNTAAGEIALWSNTTGELNAALGSQALWANTSGSQNTGVGAMSLKNNTGGGGNTAVGYAALMRNTAGVGNVAVGGMALSTSDTGGNTAVGYSALAVSQAGAGNTALGYVAGQTTLGSGNVFLGFQAGMNEVGSNRLYIANGSASPLIYGQFDSKRLGIDTVSPTNTFDVNGSLRVRNLASAGVTPVAVDANGVLILAVPSDARLKKDVVPLSESLDVLAALAGLRGVTYSWDTAKERAAGFGDRREIGLLAQDVEKVLPQVVTTAADGFKSVDYARLTALLVEVAKAQQQEIESLKSELAAVAARQR